MQNKNDFNQKCVDEAWCNYNLVLPDGILIQDDNNPNAELPFLQENNLQHENLVINIHTKKEDVVNHPKHYTFGNHEVIDIIEDWGLSYHLGNSIKYIARAGKKNKDKEIEDIKKSIWYLERHLTLLEKK